MLIANLFSFLYEHWCSLVALHCFALFLHVSHQKEVRKADLCGMLQIKLVLQCTVFVSEFEIVLSSWFTEVQLMWSDGVCCIDWLSCAYAELFIILTSRAAQATVFRIFLFHFCYTSGYPGCGARDSWHIFTIRLLFSKSKRFGHLSTEEAAIKCCISDCHAMLNVCPTMPMKQAADHDFSFSPPDCGTWISPPAQCPGLQPISPSHGHWDTIRSHQIVSFEHFGWEFSNLSRISAALKTLQKLD